MCAHVESACGGGGDGEMQIRMGGGGGGAAATLRCAAGDVGMLRVVLCAALGDQLLVGTVAKREHELLQARARAKG